jgi:hypothetical protein
MSKISAFRFCVAPMMDWVESCFKSNSYTGVVCKSCARRFYYSSAFVHTRSPAAVLRRIQNYASSCGVRCAVLASRISDLAEGSKRRHGHNRDKWPDCPQVVIALEVTARRLAGGIRSAATQHIDGQMLKRWAFKSFLSDPIKIYFVEAGLLDESVLRADDPPNARPPDASASAETASHDDPAPPK